MTISLDTALLAFAAFCVFLLFRNVWVYKSRTLLLWQDMALYDQLPPYSAMLWRFWVWDIRRFLP